MILIRRYSSIIDMTYKHLLHLHKVEVRFVHDFLTELIYKSQSSPAPYPTMLHSEQKCAHFCSEWSIVGYKTSAFWDL